MESNQVNVGILLGVAEQSTLHEIGVTYEERSLSTTGVIEREVFVSTVTGGGVSLFDSNVSVTGTRIDFEFNF